MIMLLARAQEIPYRASVRPVRSLVIYISSVFLLGALSAPWLYWLAQRVAAHFPPIQELADSPFHRYVNRSLLIFAVLGLWPFLVSLRAVSWQTVGLVNPRGQWHRLGEGFLLGFLTLATVAAAAIAVGSRKWDSWPGGSFVGEMAGIAGSSVAVALLEELLFRGTLFGALRRAHHWKVALLISSTFYAAMHFFQRVKPPPEITWTSGVEQLALMLGGFIVPQKLLPGFLSLTLAGMALGLAYHRTGNLYFCLGLHASWVFWLKTLNVLTVAGPEAKGLLRISRNLYDSWLGLAVSAGAFAMVCLLKEQKEDRADAK
jgi:membrane protease YdiL (CAAX protease family)